MCTYTHCSWGIAACCALLQLFWSPGYAHLPIPIYTCIHTYDSTLNLCIQSIDRKWIYVTYSICSMLNICRKLTVNLLNIRFEHVQIYVHTTYTMQLVQSSVLRAVAAILVADDNHLAASQALRMLTPLRSLFIFIDLFSLFAFVDPLYRSLFICVGLFMYVCNYQLVAIQALRMLTPLRSLFMHLRFVSYT